MGQKYNCFECGKEMGFWHMDYKGIRYCYTCYDKVKKQDDLEKMNRQRSENYTPAPGEIKCPYCNGWFKPVRKKPTSTTGNIARGAVFLPWGVVKAVKNKPYVECPHCHMRIPQG